MGGYGGQGIQMMGKLLAYAAEESGLYAAMIPDYTGRMRGGPSNCTVIISSGGEIVSPMRDRPDALIALNEPARRKFGNSIQPGGLLVYDSTTISARQERDDITEAGLPATELAAGCGSGNAANIVALAFFTEISGLVTLSRLRATIEEKLNKPKPQYSGLNLRAMEAGADYAGAWMSNTGRR